MRLRERLGPLRSKPGTFLGDRPFGREPFGRELKAERLRAELLRTGHVCTLEGVLHACPACPMKSPPRRGYFIGVKFLPR